MTVHLLVPDLLLPKEIAAETCAGLSVPVLEKLLARARSEHLPMTTLEAWLCKMFGVRDGEIAPVTLQADGLQPGTAHWLRADPTYVQMQREQLILQPDIKVSEVEAAHLCADLNSHFADEGLRFFAPHPQRWYLQLDAPADIVSYPPSQVAGKNLRAFMPYGTDALRWHQIFNEIQMLFFEHPVNQNRVVRGELPINSVWLWGGGRATQKLARPFDRIVGDSPLVESFTQIAGIPFTALPYDAGQYANDHEHVLIVWDGLRRALQQGDLNAWRDSLKCLEQDCIKPLWQALRSGRISRITLDTMYAGKAERFDLTRNGAWKIWCLSKSLVSHALV